MANFFISVAEAFQLLDSITDYNELDLNTQIFDQSWHFTWLIFAVGRMGPANKNLLRFLLDKVDIDERDSNGETALMLAANYGKLEVATMLLDAGADVHLRDPSGNTPLMSAARFGSADIAKLFLDRGANVDDFNHYKETALFWAVEDGYLETATILIEAGANPNAQNFLLKTPLMLASCSVLSKNEVLGLLIRNGADMNIQKTGGKTALMLAIDKSCIEQAVYLIDAGADTELINSDGKSALDMAQERGFESVLSAATRQKNRKQESIISCWDLYI